MNSNENTQSIPYDLIIQFGSGEILEGDRSVLNTWLELHPRNKMVFQEILEIQSLTGFLEIYQNLDPEKSWKTLEQKIDSDFIFPKNKKPMAVIRTLNPWILSIAASFILFIFFNFAFFHFEELKTHSNQSLTKSFEDGTRISLKSNSSLRYRVPLWGSPRIVEMNYGEIFFSVHHNPGKPFQVNLGKDKVEDMGTEFQIVKNYNSEKIDVYSGKIAFYSPESKSPQILLAGENIHFNSASGIMESFSGHDSIPGEESKSFRFLNSKLGEVAVEIEKAYHVQIQFEKPELQIRKLTGSYSNSSPDSLLNQIGLTLNLKISKTQTGFLLFR